MKRFALATALLAMMGLSIGCGGDAPAPVETPAVIDPVDGDTAPVEGEEAKDEEEAAE